MSLVIGCSATVTAPVPDDGGVTGDAGRSLDVGATRGASASPDGGVLAGCTEGYVVSLGRCVLGDAPRPVAPQSFSEVTTLRPTLRWALPAGADGAVVELCRDRACATVIETLHALGSRARPSADLPAGAVVFWRARKVTGGAVGAQTSPVWLFRTPLRSASTDASGPLHLDVNGDGYDDLVVGAYRTIVDARRGPYGVVKLYLGGPAGVSATAAQTLDGAQREDFFGGAVAAAGDVNGDGYGDVVVSASWQDRPAATQAGVVYIYLGGPRGLASAPARTLEGESEWDHLGSSVSGAGDVNGDGYADIVVGAWSQGDGSARVYLGSADGVETTPARVWRGERFEQTGRSVAGAGDVNADGFSDVLVGAPMSREVGGERLEAGRVSLYLGGASGVSATPARVIDDSVSGDWLGDSVASAGDVDGDGYGDVLVGSPYATPERVINGGTARLYLGTVNGIEAAPVATLRGLTQSDRFGALVRSAGDVNRDGYGDVIVFAEEDYSSGPSGLGLGTATLFLGSASGVTRDASHVFGATPRGGGYIGRGASGVGDLNGDGFADIAFQRVSGMGPGTVEVYQGSAEGVGVAPARVLTGANYQDCFGCAIAGLPRRALLPLSSLRRAAWAGA